MRVLQVTGSVSRRAGGPFVSVRRLSQALGSETVDVHVMGTADRWTDEDLHYWKPIEPVVLRSVGPARAELAPGLRRHLESVDAHVVHSHLLWTYSSLAVARWAASRCRPHVVSVRGMLEPWAVSFRAWRKRVVWVLGQRAALQRAAVLHATSAAERAHLRALGLTAPIAQIPNGVDMPDGTGFSAGRAERGRQGAVRVALFLSRIHPKKGLVDLVEAWDRTRPQGWVLRIGGIDEGGHEQEIRRLVAERGLTHRIEFTGEADEISKWRCFAEADLFVLPSKSENFGMVVGEAMASGLPVITTTGTPWRTLADEGAGWWVEPNPEGLGRALAESTSLDPERLAEMGTRGRALVARSYTWKNAAEQMLAVYTWVLGRGPLPECVSLG